MANASKSFKRLLPILLVGLLVQGCSPLAKLVFGISEIDEYRPEQAESFLADAQKLLPCEMIVSDSAQYMQMIHLSEADTDMMHHRSQLVQVLCFDTDTLCFYHISCYAQTGIVRINWNHYGSFDHFPPAPTVVADPTRAMTLSRYAAIYPQLAQQDKRYTVVLFWTNVLRRVSRQALEAVAQSVQGHEAECRVVLVCSDPFFASVISQAK